MDFLISVFRDFYYLKNLIPDSQRNRTPESWTPLRIMISV